MCSRGLQGSLCAEGEHDGLDREIGQQKRVLSKTMGSARSRRRHIRVRDVLKACEERIKHELERRKKKM